MNPKITKEDLKGKLTGVIKDRIDLMIDNRDRITTIKSNSITFSKPIMVKGGSNVFYPNTVNIIQGQTGAHKSRLAQHIVSAFIMTESLPYKLLGFSKVNIISPLCLYVDTERNISDQFPHAVQRILIDGGFKKEEEPVNLDYISLLPNKREERFSDLKVYLELLRHKTDRHIIVFLDVVTDCITNFNDPEESMRLIDLINDYINQYNMTFVVVIHENPKTDKARGHTGTELANKASTVIQVKLEDEDHDIIKITNLKNRNSKPFESFYARFDQNAKGLVPVEDYVPSVKSNVLAPIDEIWEYLISLDESEISRQTLMDFITDTYKCSKRTAEERIRVISKGEHRSSDLTKKYTIDKIKKNGDIKYKMNIINTLNF